MGGLIDLKRRGCESIGSWTHFETLNLDLTHDLELGYLDLNYDMTLNFSISKVIVKVKC